MIEFEKNFEEKYTNSEDFVNDFPVGHEFYWWNHELYHIVSYFEDNGLYVVIKSWTKYKQRWCYEVISAYGLYDGLQILDEKHKKTVQ